MHVGIHQPNYFPWLGYFKKIQYSDHFIFLDDVQYTKNSYINRNQILVGEKKKWMTIPVSFHFGDKICEVKPSQDAWAQRHRDVLFNAYRHAPHFKAVMPVIEDILTSASQKELSEINIYIIQRVTAQLDMKCRLIRSSDIKVTSDSPEERLIKLTQAISPQATYLSGQGGAKYQDEEEYTKAGLGFEYINFIHPLYVQGTKNFEPGLSILDALFHLGFAGTKSLLAAADPVTS